MKGDLQICFEYAMRGLGLDFSLNEDGDEYSKSKTRLAFKAFCEGYNCAVRGG